MEAARQYGVYVAYVEQGHTPLLSMPFWVSEVAGLVNHYRTLREVREIQDQRERDESQKMLRAAGLMR